MNPLYSVRQALRDVFLQPSPLRAASRLRSAYQLPPRAQFQQSGQRRCINPYTKVQPSRPTQPNASDDPLHPTNEGIGAPRTRVHLVDSETGKMSDAQPLGALLGELDRAAYMLRQVSVAPDGTPIVKHLSMAQVEESQARQRARDRQNRSATREKKELELNWAMDGNDLAHRLRRLRTFLAEGRRVEVLIAPKRRGRRATDEEAQDFLDKVKECTTDEDGKTALGKVLKAEGEVRRQFEIVFQGIETARGLEEAAEEEIGEASGVSVEKPDKIQAKIQRKLEEKQKLERRLQRKREEQERDMRERKRIGIPLPEL